VIFSNESTCSTPLAIKSYFFSEAEKTSKQYKNHLQDKSEQGLEQSIIPANLRKQGPSRLSKVLPQLNR
jgi:hypothetical protein